jgi:FXSXX-COOH protein
MSSNRERRSVSGDPPNVKVGIETDMLDVTGMSLSDLGELGASSLAYALRRVVAQDEAPTDPVVGFQASI